METIQNICNMVKEWKFKSYYVVWKQDMKKKIKETEEQFKSYYVVWKLNWYQKKS